MSVPRLVYRHVPTVTSQDLCRRNLGATLIRLAVIPLLRATTFMHFTPVISPAFPLSFLFPVGRCLQEPGPDNVREQPTSSCCYWKSDPVLTDVWSCAAKGQARADGWAFAWVCATFRMRLISAQPALLVQKVRLLYICPACLSLTTLAPISSIGKGIPICCTPLTESGKTRK